MRPGLLIALLLAIGSAAFILMSSGGQQTPVQQIASAPELKTANIFVAAQPIPIGTVIKQEMLTIQPWPDHLVLPAFIRADQGSQSVVGYVARAPFQPQEPLITSKLAKPSDPNFLAGELPKGMRIITIMTNETEGVAGFLFPGDHVDVMLTHDVDRPKMGPSGNIEIQRDSVSESLLNNVTVVAVDQRAAGSQIADAEGKFPIPRSVSLMVSPTDAQRIRLGQKIGTLTLSLRALEDRESGDPMTLTQRKDISQYKAAPDVDMSDRSAQSAIPAMSGDVIIFRGAPKESTLPMAEQPAPSGGNAANNNPANEAGYQ